MAVLNLNDLHYFARIAEHGGFSAAARRLGLPKSTLSKRLAALEAALGVRLIHRSSRRFQLTEVGRDVYEHARAVLIEAEHAEARVRRLQAEPSGTVRLTAAVPVAQFLLADHLPALARQYPELRLQLHATDRFVDLVQEGFDIAVRSHFAPLPDSSLVQRPLMVEPVWLVAAPGYLADRGVPQTPSDLAAHDALLTGPAATTWRLRRTATGDGNAREEEVVVEPRARLVADESVVLLKAAESGLGITCLPDSLCRPAIAAGRLERVLPGWVAGSVTTTALMPDRRSQLPSVRTVLRFLSERLSAAAGVS